jgi:molecular chaperone GrpE
MTTANNDGQMPDNQDFMMDEGFTSGDEQTSADGTAYANMTEESDNEAGPEPSAAEEAALWKDKYMRLSAEYDNYRKRTLKEKLDLINTGGEDVVRSLLEVLDDMDRALAAMENTAEMEAVKQGLVLIDSKLKSTLRSKGLSEVEAVGEELDADLHEAVARIDVAEKAMKGRIVEVIQKGYKLKDKIIRHPKVVIGQYNRNLTNGKQKRFLRGVGCGQKRQRRRDKEGLSSGRNQISPRQKPGRQRGRREVQRGRRSL